MKVLMQNNDQNNLFAETDLSVYLDARRDSVFKYVEELPQAQCQQSTPAVLMRDIVAQFAIAPLALQSDQMQTTYRPDKVTVPAQRAYGEIGRGPTLVAGHQMCVVLPFTGHAPLWHARPSDIGIGLQPQGIVDAELGTLTLNFAHTSAPGDNWYERRKDAMLSRIQVFINYQTGTLTQYAYNLNRVVQSAVAQRF